MPLVAVGGKVAAGPNPPGKRPTSMVHHIQCFTIHVTGVCILLKGCSLQPHAPVIPDNGEPWASASPVTAPAVCRYRYGQGLQALRNSERVSGIVCRVYFHLRMREFSLV